MQTKRKTNWFLLSAICLTVSLPALAADTSAKLYRALQPCIDDQTFAVIHLDLTKFDVDALIDYAVGQMSKHAGPDVAKHAKSGLENFRKRADARLGDLSKAGGKDIFVVFSMYEFPYFFVAVPIPSGVDRTRLLQQAQRTAGDFKVGDIETHVSDRLILVGLKQTITRLKTISAVESGDLEAAMKACAGKTLQIMLFPSSDQRRIFGEMMPKISAESGTLHPTTVGRDMNWMALGLDGPPAISLNLTIQAGSAEGADRVLTLVKGLYAVAEQYNKARPLVPDLDLILERLIPRRQGDRLRLQIDSAAANSLVDNIVAPSLAKVHAYATRMACGTNLSGIAKALLIHSNDYNDELPPDLKTLIRTVEMTPRGLGA